MNVRPTKAILMFLCFLPGVLSGADVKVEISPDAVRHEPVGNHLPLRPMKVEDGTLLYEDGTEVAVYGVNYQTMLSFEKRGLNRAGIPATAKALNDVARTDLRHIARMNQTMIRAHLIPADMSGPDGELRDSLYLDNLDFVIAECGKLGMYFYMTLMNEMNNRAHYRDSFLFVNEKRKMWGRKHWITNKETIKKSKRFISELLNHRNRYNGVCYKDDPTLGLVEIINEPSYFDFNDLEDPGVSYLKKRFEEWAKLKNVSPDRQSYGRFRTEYVKNYINQMVAAVRSAGCKKPVTWNCNWPGFITTHRDVYDAIARSHVDVISVCAYPLKAKIKSPPWKTNVDLTSANALPLFDRDYKSYDRLRWMLEQRFKDKAKAFYEYEANLSKAAYFYPYFARFQRAVGAQSATMWTYSLGPTSFHQHGHHYMNYFTAPQKAASAAAAAEIFRKTPRYTPYQTGVEDRAVWNLTDGQAAGSFKLDLGIVSTQDVYVNADHVDWQPFEVKGVPKQIIGYGSSQFVTYNGKGIYTLDLGEDMIKLEVNPDANWLAKSWVKSSYDKKKVELDYKAIHPMTLKIPGWKKIKGIHRIEDGKRVPVPFEKTTFVVSPGKYEITK